MASNLETAKRAYELFQQGDVATLIKDLVDNNCIWNIPGPKDKIPYAGNFKGKQEIGNFFARLAEIWDFTEFAPREWIEQGDTVVVLGTSVGRSRKTDKTVKNQWAHVAKYNQGKLVFFQAYEDTAAEVLGLS